MSERADFLLATLLLAAAAVAVAVAGLVAGIGSHGLLGLGALAIGVATACIFFALEIRALPPAVLLATLAAVASAAAFARTAWRIRREQRLLQALPRRPLDDSSLGSDEAARVDVVPARSANAFCAGILRPRVVVTEGLLERLDPEERRAALQHELRHAASRGPLKIALARLAARTLFWLPVLDDLLARYVLLVELDADRAAIERTNRSALAGALAEVVDAAPAPRGAVGLGDFAAARIDRLVDPRAELPRLVRRVSLLPTLAALAVVGYLVASAPHLGIGETERLHAMTLNLLAHRVGARLLGLGETATALALALAFRRALRARRG